MARKLARRKAKKQFKVKKEQVTHIFTHEMAEIAIKAMLLCDHVLEKRNDDDQSEKVAFAKETARMTTEKLILMKEPPRYSIGFDANERLMLSTAISLYMLDVMQQGQQVEHENEMAICRQILTFSQA
jgi:hypothetical protein